MINTLIFWIIGKNFAGTLSVVASFVVVASVAVIDREKVKKYISYFKKKTQTIRSSRKKVKTIWSSRKVNKKWTFCEPFVNWTSDCLRFFSWTSDCLRFFWVWTQNCFFCFWGKWKTFKVQKFLVEPCATFRLKTAPKVAKIWVQNYSS